MTTNGSKHHQLTSKAMERFLQGATIYQTSKYESSYQVAKRLRDLPRPLQKGWGFIRWHRRLLGRLAGYYICTMSNGAWLRSRKLEEVVNCCDPAWRPRFRITGDLSRERVLWW